MYIGPEKIILVLVIALLVLGPERLPQVARQAGRAYHEFRRVTSGLEAEVREKIHEPIRQAFTQPEPATPSAPQASSIEAGKISGAPSTSCSDPQPALLGDPTAMPPSSPERQPTPPDVWPLARPAGDPKLN
jgi:sec-independent protein translocase protein TatB